jgi:branched-chain amino acid transport system ATP-binding protein
MLSGGQRQMLGVSLALVKRPRLLLLDEPSLGIAPNLVERLMKSLGGIRTTLATSIVLVDQAIRSAIDISDRVYVMRMGRIVLSGRSSEMGEDTDLWRYF